MTTTSDQQPKLKECRIRLVGGEVEWIDPPPEGDREAVVQYAEELAKTEESGDEPAGIPDPPPYAHLIGKGKLPELSPEEQEQARQDFAEFLRVLKESKVFDHIEDPVAWQREIRRERYHADDEIEDARRHAAELRAARERAEQEAKL
jgi:hypothetical protein